MTGFDAVLIANRSAVASRVIRAVKGLGLRAIAVYSDADAEMAYLSEADATIPLGGAAPRDSYLDQAKLIDAARRSGAQAIHPGYGFLSENATFARRVREAGLVFIGPDPALIEMMGEKTRARDLMQQNGIPVGAGSGLLDTDGDAITREAQRIGYPVLVKPAAGGGGIGMLVARNEAELLPAVERSRSMATRSFGDAQLYLESLVESPRHIEFQMIGDRHGDAWHLFERDCSLQRRHQKIIEESPAPHVPRSDINALGERLRKVLTAIRYDSIGTIECLMGRDGSFRFLEMNTRLQVEHAVTEMVIGRDLVAAQIRVAGGDRLADILSGEIVQRGHAVEVRICSEDPKSFLPSSGLLTTFRLPAESADLRVETGYRVGVRVTPFYDSLLAKIIAHGDTREAAINLLQAGLDACEITGVKSNIPLLRKVLDNPQFQRGEVHTGLLVEIVKT